MRKLHISKKQLKHMKRLVALVLIAALFGQTVSTRFFSTAYAAGIEDTAAETSVSTELIDTNVPVTVVGEVESLRNEKEKHFRMSDGSFMAVSYGMAVHYEDENGEWQDIDNRMVLSADQSRYLTENLQTATAFASTLNSGSLFETIVGDTSVGMALMDTSQANEIMSARQEELELAVIRGTQLSTSAIGSSVLDTLDIKAAVGGTVGEAVELSSAAAIAAMQEEIAKLKNLISQSALLNFDRTSVADITVAVPNAVNTSQMPSAGEDSTTDPGTGWTVADILPENLQDAVLYEDVFPGVDLLYTKYSHNVKEQIIVKNPQTSCRYDFELTLDGVEAVLNEDGSVALVDEDGAVAYYIPAPFMEDADGVISYDVEYIVTPMADGIILSVVADEEWMNAEERAYPVAIDPTLTVEAGAVKEDIFFAYTAQGTPDSFYGGALHSYIGYTPWKSIGQYIGFMHFKTMPQIPAGMTVVDATLRLFLDGYTCVGRTELDIGIYEVTDQKPETIDDYYYWVCRLTWNTMPNYDEDNMIDYTVVSLYNQDAFYYWDLTELVKRWYIEGEENRTITLRGPGDYTDTNYGEACFYAWGTTAPPMILISYRDTRGIEPYYTYNTLGVGNAGAAYIADATGQLKVVKNIASYASTVNPFSLNLVYNSDYFSANGTADYQPPEQMGLESTINPDMLLGQGWTLDILQTMKTETIDSVEYICYHDGDGTKHYFAKDSSDNLYYDEDGLGLKIQNNGSNNFVMSDDQDNTWTFTSGKLTSVADATGNKYTINYSSNKITTITQTNKSQTAITVATFTYSGDYVSSITDAAGNVYSFTYSGEKLASVSMNGTVIATYEYEDEGNRLVKMTDSESAYAIDFDYSMGRICRYQEYGGTTAGATAVITYPNHSMTTYQQSGTDSTLDTADDLYTHYQFDYAGRTANACTTDVNNNILGATNAVYTGTGTTDKTNNRTQRTASIGAASPNEINCSGFETGVWGWTMTNGTQDTAKHRTGSYAMKGTAADASTLVSATHPYSSLTAGKTYTYSAYINTTELTSITGTGIYLQVTDSAGNTFSSKAEGNGVVDYITSSEVDDGWIRIQMTFTAEISGKHTAGIYGTGIVGNFYADDVQLEAGKAPGTFNLLENGSMETSGHFWSVTSGAFADGEGLNGSTAIKLTGSPAAAAKAQQNTSLNYPITDTFVLSGWARANAVPDTLNAEGVAPERDVLKQFGLRANVCYSDGTHEYFYAPFNSDLSDWQFTALTIVPTKVQPESGDEVTINSINVTLAYEGNANVAYFDNISLVREAAQTMRYDDDGNLEAVTTTGLSEDVNTYENGNLIQTVTGGNGTYTYTYDETYKHRVTGVTDGVITQTMGYDTTGNVTSTTLKSNTASNPLTISTSAVYTNNGNLLSSVTDPLGNTVSYGYSSALNKMYGLPSTVTDPKGVITSATYDTLGRTTGTTITGTADVDYVYSSGNLSQIVRTNSNSIAQTYNLTYNVFGNLTAIKVGSRSLAGYTYGANNGYLTKLTYGNSDYVTYTYDILGRVIRENYSEGRVVTYTYNNEGQLSTVTDSVSGSTYYTYDSLDRLIYSYHPSTGVRVKYTYDSNNRLTKTDYLVDGWSSTYEQYTYNTLTTDSVSDGLLTSMRMVDGNYISLNYDYLQRPWRRNISGGLTEYFGYIAGTKTNQTSTLSDGKTTALNSTVKNDIYCTYDSNNNLATVSDTVTGIKITYTYDNQNQLISAVHSDGRTESYTYDSVGNILSFNNGTTSHSYTYGNSSWRDLLTAVDGTTLTYDTSGNPTSYFNGSTYTMSWIEGRRLSSLTTGGKTTTYQYNADGLRVRKNNSDGSYVLYLITDGMTIGEKHYNSSGTVSKNIRYTFNDNGAVCGYSTSTDGTTWIDYYFITNIQGDVQEVLRKNDWVTVATYTYDSWGNILSSNGTNADENPFRYRGYYYDVETGFYCLSSRYYDPEVGRFINADDVSYLGADGSPLSYNLFAYCYNNPVNMADDTGYLPFFVITGIAGALIGGVIGYAKTGSWKGALGGAAIGGAIGLTGGAGAAKLLAGSAIASTGMVIVGGKAFLAAAGILSQADKISRKVGSIYRSLTQGNFRYNLQKLTDSLGKGMQAHHIFPQKFINYFSKAGINIHNPLYGSWVDSTHQSWSKAYNAAWEAFFNTVKKPTAQQIFSKAAELAEQFGFILNWEVKK